MLNDTFILYIVFPLPVFSQEAWKSVIFIWVGLLIFVKFGGRMPVGLPSCQPGCSLLLSVWVAVTKTPKPCTLQTVPKAESSKIKVAVGFFFLFCFFNLVVAQFNLVVRSTVSPYSWRGLLTFLEPLTRSLILHDLCPYDLITIQRLSLPEPSLGVGGSSQDFSTWMGQDTQTSILRVLKNGIMINLSLWSIIWGKKKLQRGKFYFGSLYQRCQSVVTWFHCFWVTVRWSSHGGT